MTVLFIPKEIRDNETRVAINVDCAKRYIKDGFTVLVETNAAQGSFLSDTALTEAGAEIVSATDGYAKADMVLKVNAPTTEELAQYKKGTTLISFIYPIQNEALLKALAEKGINAYSMDQVPRITRAQKLDALSSQSNLAGYKAVLMAANQLPKIFPLLMTAAGTIRPAKVVIVGAGVAGLQAIATAKRLGAVVDVSDIRPAVKEQVQSLGANYIEVPSEENLETAGGYAKEASPEFLKKQAEITRKHFVEADVIITTALIPGRPAPKLVSADVVKEMKAGSVIVDLAAEQGGNCELTESGKTIEAHGITIMGELNLPGKLSANASDIYAKNIYNAIQDNLSQSEKGKDKPFAWNFDDEIVDKAMSVYDGTIRQPQVREALGLPALEKTPEPVAAS